MRRSYNAQGILKDEHGNIFGIALGSDFCAEHEIGFNSIKRAFGIELGHTIKPYQPKTFGEKIKAFFGHKFAPIKGLIRRTAAIIPMDNILFHKGNKGHSSFLIYRRGINENKISRKDLENRWADLKQYKNQDMVCSWDDKAFGIHAYGDEAKEALKLIHAAMKNNDLALWMGQVGSHNMGGLTVAIANKIPDAIKQEFMERDDKYEMEGK